MVTKLEIIIGINITIINIKQKKNWVGGFEKYKKYFILLVKICLFKNNLSNS